LTCSAKGLPNVKGVPVRSVLLQLHVGGPEKCESWADAPVAHGVQITVYVENGGGFPELLARKIHAAIERELSRLQAHRGKAPCTLDHGDIFPAHTCAGAVAGLAKRVLVFVADGKRSINQQMEQYFTEPGSVIIPVVDTWIAVDPARALPLFMQTTLAEVTTNADPGPVIGRVLRAAGLLGRSMSVFISYRHVEAAPIAGQLFHKMAERGFEPFLDRFCNKPGDDFVDLIREELADKACLVSLETPHIRRSLYCRQEVATAVSRRMGLIAVDLPGSQRTFSVIAKRINATKDHIGADGTLPPTAIERIVDEFQRHFPHEVARRPRWQDQNLYDSLVAAGLSFSAEGLGRYLARGRRGTQWVLAMSATLPNTDLFIEIEERRDPSGANRSAAIFGPVSAARTNLYGRIDWLAQKSGVRAHDEGRLMRYIRRLQ
jgi:hypothetical protein